LPLKPLPPDKDLRPRRAVDGVLLLDKPRDLSSTQAMAAAKRYFRALKAGHTGTLDPFATGLLPICFGEATKFSRFMLDADKRYRATLKLGATSSTGDTEGSITTQALAPLTDEGIHQVLATFVGRQFQTPPMHSALKQDGVPLYELARQGIEVDRAAREIVIHSLSLVSHQGDSIEIDTLVSKGTYIRVLAQDVGAALGCGAYLTALRRTGTGGFNVEQAYQFADLEQMDATALEACLLPADTLCAHLPNATLDDTDARIFANGGWLTLAPLGGQLQALQDGTLIRVYRADASPSGPVGGSFLGIGQVGAGGKRLIPERLMSTQTTGSA
jgi:tRNA pseudouridine55 synthase